MLRPYDIKKFYTDNWGSYARHIDDENCEIGKRNTQRIERRNLTIHTRIKRLALKTICFSKSEIMYHIVIDLFINFHEFGLIF